MCIIAIKKAGLELPDTQIFKNCFKNNDDGAGFMYTKNGKVIIEKGFMKINSFLNSLDKVKKLIDTKETPMIFHFRIGTQGGNIPANTHPFPISDDEDMLRKLRLVTDIGVVHNGIISLTSSYKKEIKLSDTMIFIKDYLSLIAMDKNFYKNKHSVALVEKLVDSKMAFLTGDGEIITIGKFTEDNGMLYSNSSYLTSYYSYIYGYNDYDDYSNNYYPRYKNYNKVIPALPSSTTETSESSKLNPNKPSYVSSKVNNSIYEKKLMWLPYCFYHYAGEYYELDEYAFLMDKNSNIYEYDYHSDEAVYFGTYVIVDESLKTIDFDEEYADWVKISNYFVNSKETDSIDLDGNEDDLPFSNEEEKGA